MDYGKSNPNSIGLFFPIDAELNGGNAALVCFDTSPYIESFTYEEVLARENLMVYWDAENGYNESMQESGESDDAPVSVTGGEIEGGTAYIGMMEGMGGAEAHEFDLMDDGTCKFFLPGNAMITDVYAGTYEIAADGVTVSIKGLANVDSSSPYPTPGLWSYIDSATGDATITIDTAAFTFTVEGMEAPAGDGGEAPTGEGTAYTCEFDGAMGKETLEIDLLDETTCRFFLPGNAMIADVYEGSYVREGDTVTITGLKNIDTSSEFTTPGLWSFIDSATGDAVVTVDDASGTFTPVE